MMPYCAAVDWGTSRFRLWILGADGTVMHEISTDEGLQKSSKIGFETVLETHLKKLNCSADLPVIICGMAGSRNGWVEAPYLDTPAELSNVIKNSVTVPHDTRDIKILPGIAQRNPAHPDVLRGEETQLFGMLANQKTSASQSSQIICMPGTHSKWVLLVADSVSQFTTFMSGELFALIAEHSILHAAIDVQQNIEPNDEQFIQSVQNAVDNPAEVTSQLFALRSSQLLGYTEPLSAKAALSGTVIGLEIAGAFARYGKLNHVTLLASGNLAQLYESALNALDVKPNLSDAENAGRNGLYHAACMLWDDDAIAPETITKLRKV